MIRIALIGDPNPEVIAHQAIPAALQLAAAESGTEATWHWLPTVSLVGDLAKMLSNYQGVWCVPATPYQNATGALAAIRYARLSGLPYLGTCGGFQHALLEYAASCWQLYAAAHAETDPQAIDPLIAPLSCPLVEVTGKLHFVGGTRLARAYGVESAVEGYHCSYGLNPLYEERLRNDPLQVAARDDAGSIRAVELTGNQFFVATLFQPERAALRGQVPPIVRSFLAAAAGH
jgi:CTP synthase (UTP-ammonia lyase)